MTYFLGDQNDRPQCHAASAKRAIESCVVVVVDPSTKCRSNVVADEAGQLALTLMGFVGPSHGFSIHTRSYVRARRLSGRMQAL